MDKVIVVSGDSHAVMPEHLWEEYLERRYHEFLPAAREDAVQSAPMRDALFSFSEDALRVMDPEGIWASGGYLGVWDLQRRLAEMDREGVAAEFVNASDGRAHQPLVQRKYSQELIAAGARAYTRWAADEFGPAADRLLLVGDATAAVDMDAMLAEIDWMAEHRFAAAYVPSRVSRGDFPPLHDEFYEPFWAKCEELGLPVVVHSGHRQDAERGMAFSLEEMKEIAKAAGRKDVLEYIVHLPENFEMTVHPRRALWQVLLSGVFDRHPNLRFITMEIRGDWLPGTLAYLDAEYMAARADMPGKRLPSEYWRSNCMSVLSFMHKSEMPMRHEIGIENITFGRDYPHPEGTWPNTAQWLGDLFAGVPEDEVRLMLGENMIRFLGLDRAHLQGIADRVGPSIEQITGSTRTVDQLLLENFQYRGGYLKPAEQFNLPRIEALVQEDIAYARSKR